MEAVAVMVPPHSAPAEAELAVYFRWTKDEYREWREEAEVRAGGSDGAGPPLDSPQ